MVMVLNFDGAFDNAFDNGFDDAFDQVTGLATIKQGAAPAPQVENQLNNDYKNNDTY